MGLSLEEEREVLLGGLKGGRETRCGHLRVDESHKRSARLLSSPLHALLCVVDEVVPSLAVAPTPRPRPRLLTALHSLGPGLEACKWENERTVSGRVKLMRWVRATNLTKSRKASARLLRLQTRLARDDQAQPQGRRTHCSSKSE